MSVETIIVKPFTPTVEITQSQILPRPEIIVDSLKPIERIAEKTPSPATPTAIRDIISRGSERLRYYRRGRRPRCHHGKRRGDISHQCGDGVFGSTSSINTSFKITPKKLFNLSSKSSGLY